MIGHIAEDAFDAKSYVSSVFRIRRPLASRQSRAGELNWSMHHH